MSAVARAISRPASYLGPDSVVALGLWALAAGAILVGLITVGDKTSTGPV